MATAPTTILAHWSILIEALQASPMDFYAQVEAALERRQVPDTKRSRVDWREGGILSAKREYLRVQRREHIVDICGAPFGTGFFFSWWLGENRGCLGSMVDVPFLGSLISYFVKPVTYYQIDTSSMFRAAASGAVQEVVDQMTTTKGLRHLTADERKPMLKEFFRP
jgi:hypothetical protein